MSVNMDNNDTQTNVLPSAENSDNGKNDDTNEDVNNIYNGVPNTTFPQPSLLDQDEMARNCAHVSLALIAPSENVNDLNCSNSSDNIADNNNCHIRSNTGLEMIDNEDNCPDRRRVFEKGHTGLEIIDDGDSPDQRQDSGRISNASSSGVTNTAMPEVIDDDGEISPDIRISNFDGESRLNVHYEKNSVGSMKAKDKKDNHNKNLQSKEDNTNENDIKLEEMPEGLSKPPRSLTHPKIHPNHIAPASENSAINSAYYVSNNIATMPGARPTTRSLVTKSSMAHISRYYSSANLAASNSRNSMTAARGSLPAAAASTSALGNFNNELSPDTINAESEIVDSENQVETQPPTIQGTDSSSHVIIEATLVEDPIEATVVGHSQRLYSNYEEERNGDEEQQVNGQNDFSNDIIRRDSEINQNKKSNTETRAWYKRKEFIGVLLLLIVAVTISTVATRYISNDDNNAAAPTDPLTSTTDATDRPSTGTTATIPASITITNTSSTIEHVDNDNVVVNAPTSAPMASQEQLFTTPATTTTATTPVTTPSLTISTTSSIGISSSQTQSKNDDNGEEVPTNGHQVNGSGVEDDTDDNTGNKDLSLEENEEGELTPAETYFTSQFFNNFDNDSDQELFCDKCYGFVAMDGENAMVAANGKVYFYHFVPSVATTDIDISIRNNTNNNNSSKYEWELLSIMTMEESNSDYYIPAISGNVAVIGAPDEVTIGDGDNNGGTVDKTTLLYGAVFVFELSSDQIGDGQDTTTNNSKKTWSQTAKLVPDDLIIDAAFGNSISVLSNIITSSSYEQNESNSDIIAVGAPEDRIDESGSVYIFRRFHSNGGLQENYADGGTLPLGKWFQEAKLAPQNPNLEDFGWEVEVYQILDKNVSSNTATNAMKSMTTVVAVGDDWYGEPNSGAVFLYRYDGFINSSEANLGLDNDNKDEGIIMNSDVNITNGGKWSRWGPILLNSDCDADFGVTIVSNNLDQSLAIGCFDGDNSVGSVYYYVYNDNASVGNDSDGEGEIYSFQQKIVPSDGVPGDEFANYLQVDLHDNLMIVGSSAADDDRGKVYVFVRQMEESINGTGLGMWKELDVLRPLSGQIEYFFGNSVAMHGNQILLSGEHNVYSFALNNHD